MTHTDKNNVLVLGMDLYIIIIIFNTDVPIQSDIFKETYKKRGERNKWGWHFIPCCMEGQKIAVH